MDTLPSFVHRILFLGSVVCIFASANLMLDYNWPSGPDPNINRFPHESSCHYYYLMLSEEDISLEKCPGGQLFDYTKHSCISDTEHIHCWSRHFGKLKHGHLQMKHKKHFKCPYPWGKYPNLHDCSKYHLCLNGKSMAKKCAPFELFDKISRKCIASIDAVCADKSDVIEHGYVCPKAWGSFTYPKDCSKYYECLQKKPSLRMCQKGYLFDDRLAKCAPKEKVYCGLRHNPYGKVSSDAPETSPSIPSTISTQKSTILNLDVTTIKATERITSENSAPQEIKSTTLQISSIPNEITSLSQESSSNFQKVSSLPQTTSTNLQKIASTQAPSNKPITEIPSPSVGETNNNEKKVSSISDVPQLMNKVGQETSDPTEDVSEEKEFVEISSTTEKEQAASSSQIAVNDESEVLKKDVSTEEKDTDDVSDKVVTVGTQKIEGSSDSSSKIVCLPQDPMCITEKDGTVVKCSNSKDLQPHPKDETRFLDCTESSIKIYSCPPNLTFKPRDKKCMWQFIL